jgi:hypothetical protein
MTPNYGTTEMGGPSDDHYGGNDNGGGGMPEEERLYKFRFKIPEPAENMLNVAGQPAMPAVNRVLVVCHKAFKVWEHSLFKLKTSHFNTMCLLKNKLDSRECPICSPDGGNKYASFNGFFTIINMGQVEYLPDNKFMLHHRKWTDRNGKVHYDAFPRMLLVARWGTDKRPGQLRVIESEMSRLGGSLMGTVWDITRTSKQTEICGNGWRYIETISVDNFERYLQRYGAKDVNVKEIDYHTVIKPLSYDELAQMVGWKTQSQEQHKPSETEGAGYDGSYSGGGYGDSSHRPPQQQELPQDGGHGPPTYSDVPPPRDDDIPF